MKHEPRPAFHMEKQLGWACKLGGAESLGTSRAEQTMLARLMESQIWDQSASSVALWREGSERKNSRPLCLGESCPRAPTFMPDTSLSPCMPLVPF